MNVIIVIIIFFLIIIINFGLLLCLDLLMIFDYCFLDWVVHPRKDIWFLFDCKNLYFSIDRSQILLKEHRFFFIIVKFSFFFHPSIVTQEKRWNLESSF